MQTKRIMVIEADEDRLKQTNFLLRLSGHEARTIINIHEGVNWSRLCHQSGEDVLCLLINSVSSPAECVSMLQELSVLSFPLPVIMVRRGQWDGAVLMARFPTLRILFCPPSTINAALTAIEKSHPRRNAAIQQVSA